MNVRCIPIYMRSNSEVGINGETLINLYMDEKVDF